MGQKVSYDYDRSADFTRLRTYALKDSPAQETRTEETTTYDNPLVEDRINAAVASQLESRGMRRAEGHPDVYVVTRQTFETQKNYTVYNPYGWGWVRPYGWGLAVTAGDGAASGFRTDIRSGTPSSYATMSSRCCHR
jgi:hypothetical protein